MKDFDEQKATRAIRFFERHCTHIKGRWAGQRFQLIPWEGELLWELFGRVKPDGFRRYRICYCEIPKKNGKSELAAGIALKMLVADDEYGGEVYSAAADRKQAELVFDVAAQMVRNDPVLRKRLKIIDSRKQIADHRSNSFYQALSRETFTKHGLNPSAIIFDELHAQKTRELWDVLVEGTDAARTQQLIFAISTAGVYDQNSICWEIREHGRQILEGIIEDPSFLPVMYYADKGEDWENEKVWERVNPSLGYIFDLDVIRKHYKEAKEIPARQNNFRRYRLNEWVNQVSRWMPMDKWDLCDGEVAEKELLRRTCYGGLDLSSSIDMTAFVLVFPPVKKKEKWKVLPYFFIPEERMGERVKRDRVPYNLWVEAGLIEATPGNVIDYSFIKKRVVNCAKLFNLKEVAYDPWGAVKLAVELNGDEGIDMVEFRQGFKSMSPPTKELLVLVLGKQIEHGGNPVLRWCADNMVVEIDAAENIKPNKQKATERIDGMVALIMGLGRAIVNEEGSIYDERGVLVFG